MCEVYCFRDNISKNMGSMFIIHMFTLHFRWKIWSLHAGPYTE